MKLTIILIILALTLISACTQQVQEQTEITAEVANTPTCPRGLTNDPYPGICHLYQDINSNDICDLSG